MPRKAKDKPRQIAKQKQAAVLEQSAPENKVSLILQAQNATGVPHADAASILVAQAAALPALQSGTAREDLQTALHLLEQIKPEGVLQSMLAAQMIGVHNSALKFLRRAADEGRTFEGTDANVNRGVRLLRLFNEQLHALGSLRGKTSEQKVTVEHVHVHEGGQAIVGSVGAPLGEGNAN